MNAIISHITDEISLVGQGAPYAPIRDITRQDMESILSLTETDSNGNVRILGGIATLQKLKMILGKYL